MTYNPIKACLSIAFHPGNRDRKLSSLVRYVKWQISARLTGLVMVFPWIEDSKLFMRLNESMVTHNYYTGLYEYDDMIFLLRYLKPKDVMVDIGANSGVFSVLAAKVKKASVLAFEPIPQTYSRLLNNIQLNELNNLVICVNKGLSNRVDELSFTTTRDATNHVCTNYDEDQLIRVKVSTLDNEVNRYSIIPTVLKIDVEGYELFVLEGACKVLAAETTNVVLVELNESTSRYGQSDNDVARKLLTYGFTPYNYSVSDNTLTPIPGYKSSKQNTLFIRDLELAKKKIEVFETYYIHTTHSSV